MTALIAGYDIAAIWIIRPDVDPKYSQGVQVIDTCNPNGLTWAVRNGSWCMNKGGMWEYEPQPSSRTDKWFRNHRWTSLDAAIKSAMKAVKHE